MRKGKAAFVFLLLASIVALNGCGDFYASGRVVQEIDGRYDGVAGVTIVAVSGDRVLGTTQTDNQGFWFLNPISERAIIYAEKVGFCFALAYEVYGKAGGLDFLAEPGYEAWGRVKDESGLPIQSVYISFSAQPARTGGLFRPTPRGLVKMKSYIPGTYTDAEGYWFARSLPASVIVMPGKAPMGFYPEQAVLTNGGSEVNFTGRYAECSGVKDIFSANGMVFIVRSGEYPWVMYSNGDWPAQESRLADLTAFDGGNAHFVALKPDMTVWSWGRGSWGQLGAGFIYESYIPVMAYRFTGAVKADAAGDCTYVLKDDGTVWFWGEDILHYGMFQDVPKQLNFAVRIVDIAAGARFLTGLDADGSVWGWGYNTYGQLGSPPASQPLSSPTKLEGLPRIVSLSAANDHVLAVTFEGKVWAWGMNDRGQLGKGSFSGTEAPFEVPGLTNVKKVATGYWVSVALKEDGTVWEWGAIRGISDGVAAPVRIPGIDNVTSVAVASNTTTMLRADGTVWQWFPGNTAPIRIQYLNIGTIR